MNGMPDISALYSTADLTEAAIKLNVPGTWVLKNVFSKKEMKTSRVIDAVTITNSKRSAPFVSIDAEEAKATKKRSMQPIHLSIPRSWEAKIWTMEELEEISLIGQRYSKQSERDKEVARRIAEEIEDMKQNTIRASVILGWQLLNTGKIAWSTDEANFKMDFKFGVKQTEEALTGDDLWTAAASNPAEKINEIRKKAPGIDTMILGSTAAKAWRNNVNVRKDLENKGLIVGSVDFTKTINGEDVYELSSNWMGLKVYESLQSWEDYKGNTKNMVDDTRAIFINSKKKQKRYYAPIKRLNQANKLGVKTFNQEMLLESEIIRHKLQWSLESNCLPAIYDKEGIYTLEVVEAA
jgi:Phage major capsid protein E